jgi:hypothetical protein
MNDTPTRGPLQPQNPNLMMRIAAEEAAAQNAREAGTPLPYTGPRFDWWFGPRLCVWCNHIVSAHENGHCWTVNGKEANDTDCPCDAYNFDDDE